MPLLPTITLPGGEYALVPTHWLVPPDRDSVRALLHDAVHRDPTALEALRGLLQQDAATAANMSAEHVIDAIAEAVASGRLAAILTPPESSGRPHLARDPQAPTTDDVVPAARTGWVSFEIVDHDGAAFADLDVTIEHSGERVDEARLDARGRHRLDRVAIDRPVHVVVPRPLPTIPITVPRPDGFKRRANDLATPRESRRSVPIPRLEQHIRIIVDAPKAHPTVSLSASSFAVDSALPTAAIAQLVTIAHETCDRDPHARVGLFAHTDSLGSADQNKALADRRAKAAFAILTGDWPAFAEAVPADTLTQGDAQMILRLLGCNPTAIDGESGAQTELSISAFRIAYNRDTWHDEGRARAYGELPSGTSLDAATKAALLDAYHAELSGRLDPKRFVGPRFAGCGEFNPLAGASEAQADRATDNRRITLAIYGGDTPRDLEFPCRTGDAGACAIDGRGSFTCKFYRERIAEQRVEDAFAPFWDFEWLKTESGKAHLSALTVLGDDDEVEIVVRRGRLSELADENGVGPPPDEGRVVARLPALIRSGVAYALWDHGTIDPFRFDNWFEASGPRALLRDYAPFFFTVEAQRRWGRSGPPGYRLHEMTFARPPEADVALALRTDGTLLLLSPTDVPQQGRSTHVAGFTGRGLWVDSFED